MYACFSLGRSRLPVRLPAAGSMRIAAGRWSAVALLLACAFGAPRLTAQPAYTVSVLDPVPFSGGYFRLRAINNRGDIVGYLWGETTGERIAFLYSQGRYVNLGMLDPTLAANRQRNFARALNAFGQVTGDSTVGTTFGPLAQPYRYENGEMRGQGFWGSSAAGYGINNLGVIAGSGLSTVNDTQRAFVCPDGGSSGYIDLGTLVPRDPVTGVSPGTSNAYALNDAGQAVGDAEVRVPLKPSSETHAALFRHGTVIDLGTLGGTFSSASEINRHGLIAGESSLPGDLAQHAFVYANGTLTDLGTFGGSSSYVGDLNNHGQLIGSAETATGWDNFIYTAQTGLRHLPHGIALSNGTSPGFLNFSAQAINDLGQIAGTGDYFDGANTSLRLIVLTPVPVDNVVNGSAEVVGRDIRHPNGNVYDQALLTGPTATLRADPGQILRCSFLDPDGDIVQCEFSGPGEMTILLDPATYLPPAPPAKYNQPGVVYVTGQPTIMIDNCTAETNVNIFTVGRATAVNQGLFPAGQAYDGIADVQLLQIGGPAMANLFLGNTRFSGASGLTGIFAPGTAVQNRAILHDIEARGVATPLLRIGPASPLTRDLGSVLLAGGDLAQPNHVPVDITAGAAGTLESIVTVANIRSDGSALPRGDVAGAATFSSRGPGSPLVDGAPVALSPASSTRELTFTPAPDTSPVYPAGTRKSFTASMTGLTSNGGSLYDPVPLQADPPVTGAVFTSAVTGLSWEVVFRQGVLHEIGINRGGVFLGRWQ